MTFFCDLNSHSSLVWTYSLVRLSFFCEHRNLVAEEWYGKGDVLTVHFFILLNLFCYFIILHKTENRLAKPPFSSVQSLSSVRIFVTPWTAACQASLSISNSQSLLKLMSIELVRPSNHLILCRPLLLPSIFPSIRVFSNESVLRIRWPKYWSFSFNIRPSNEYSRLISFTIDWFDLL